MRRGIAVGTCACSTADHRRAAGSKCDPFKLYPGVMVTRFGCTAPRCQHTVAPGAAASLDDCLDACAAAGYGKCKAATYDPSAKACHLYTQRLEDMGAHASAAVHVKGGLGAVTASYCSPPSDVASYPDVPTSKFGALSARGSTATAGRCAWCSTGP